MLKYYDIEQGTKEWRDVRKLHFTASHASTIMANGKGLTTLIKEMLAEHYSSGTFEEYTNEYKNSNMQRGNEFENKARAIYELETGREVKQIGFVELDEHIGVSPDGLVGDDGLIEIKNHNDKVFLELILTGKIDKKYLDQMQMQMYVTGRKWCDYVAFNPNYAKSLIIVRQYPDIDKFELLRQGLQSGIFELKEMKNKLDERLKYV